MKSSDSGRWIERHAHKALKSQLVLDSSEKPMSIVVSPQDPRYDTLKHGHNLRWPENNNDAASLILICEGVQDIETALQQAVSAGQRPTVRSGAHCYEDFAVNNPGGVILDLSLLSEARRPEGQSAFRIAAGTQLWSAYAELYKRYGVTLPAGTCGTVGAGGHICGGGYGLLARLYGLSCDWLTSIEILTIDAQGKVVHRTANATRDTDLFRACRGAGGGNFGIITNYYFEKLPPAPQNIVQAHMRFLWAGMTEDRFVRLLTTFGRYCETRGQDRDTWGMFIVISLGHAVNPGFSMSVQFLNPDGSCEDLTVLNEYLDLFTSCGGVTTTLKAVPPHGAGNFSISSAKGETEVCLGSHTVLRRSWFTATGEEAGGPGASRAKYKSAYFKRGFTEAEARCFYKHMHRTVPGGDMRGSVVEIDSYGGAINRKELVQTTAMCQRSSIIKIQPMTFWSNPQDAPAHCQWIREFYTELFSGPDADPKHPGTPYPSDRYDGCYINYPDKDMLAFDYWPKLYYGDLYPFLQTVKRKYDPNNIFHHAMSIRPQ